MCWVIVEITRTAESVPEHSVIAAGSSLGREWVVTSLPIYCCLFIVDPLSDIQTIPHNSHTMDNFTDKSSELIKASFHKAEEQANSHGKSSHGRTSDGQS